MAKRKAKQPGLALKPGDQVLVGGRGCMPWQWWFAAVLWADAIEVLTEHVPPSSNGSSELHRQVLSIEESIIAVGSYTELSDFKDTCAAETRELSDQVSACEQALGRARDAVEAKVAAIYAAARDAATKYGAEVDPLAKAIETIEAESRALHEQRFKAAERRRKARP